MDIRDIIKRQKILTTERQMGEENQLKESFKKGDKVIALSGVHRGDKHEVIHTFGDGTYNIRPLTHRVKYRLGAAKASEEDLKLVEDINESVDNEDVIKNLAAGIRDKFGLEVSMTKSTLGGKDRPATYFLKVFGPKDTWKNGIAQNSPFHVMFSISDGELEMTNNSYQVRNAKAKMRKTKFKDDVDLEKKLMAYFTKNKSKIDDILKEDLNESIQKGSKVKIVGDDDRKGQHGTVYRYDKKKQALTVKFKDGGIESFGEDEVELNESKKSAEELTKDAVKTLKSAKDSLDTIAIMKRGDEYDIVNTQAPSFHTMPKRGWSVVAYVSKRGKDIRTDTPHKYLQKLAESGGLFESKKDLPPHLAKLVGKDGDFMPEAKKRLGKVGKERLMKAKSKDVTPKGYGPNEEAVLAYDKDGKLVGRFKDMKTAKKLKPNHRYEIDEATGDFADFMNEAFGDGNDLFESVKNRITEKMNSKNGDYTINHKTFSSAVQHAIEVVEKRGYEVDEDEWDRKVALGPKKPSKGKTNSYTIALLKNGKETRRNLQMQVYYDEGRYELNMYIS